MQTQVSTEDALKLMERQEKGETVVDLAKEVGVPTKYLYNKFANIRSGKIVGVKKSAIAPKSKPSKKVKIHAFTDIPLEPRTKKNDGRILIALVPTTSLREFLSEVF